MRSVDQIRAKTAETLDAMLSRPSMFGTGQAFEWTIRSQLFDLSFIDDRDSDLAELFGQLEERGLFGALGCWGALSAVLGPAAHTDEIASVYARIAARLGYLRPHRRLTISEWQDVSSARSWATEQPRRRGDVEERFGAPSYLTSRQHPRVLAYAGPDDDAWLYFDFAEGDDASLRDVRFPAYPLSETVLDLRLRDEQHIRSPEAVYRRFLIASLSGRESEVRPFLVPKSDPALLWEGPYPPDVSAKLAQHFRSMDVVRVDSPHETVFLVSDGCPVALQLRKHGDTWLVDPEPLLQLRADVRGARRSPTGA